ncbi:MULTISPECIES: acyl transferase [unclassified Lentimicrobium]|uniref:LuxE/PaaK family acyltransferase n=1 Tax=unclassified Lentimicrobium TaxID=2677434 RepID=UPI001557F62F|nr:MULTISPECIES: acyl transferase [unclassified Lentimicrobium]NPD44078.1 acyl transferase [Lentimicrobium sp. S6]NPD86739.1 acyl transferase [Lentimicrobium sp. L6]
MGNINLFNNHSSEEFKKLSLQLFQKQYQQIPVYRSFVDALKIKPQQVGKLADIPFMPIEFFKDYKVLAKNEKTELLFKSSGTTGMQRSQHFVKSAKVYKESFIKGFEYFYGPITNYIFLALLPSYLENGDSSLVYMADHLIELSKSEDSGFYLNDYSKIIEKLHQLKSSPKKVMLLGVSYALLDLVEMQDFDCPNLTIMETGGMKGRRKEMVREELHEIIRKGFGVEKIHSEYGMTELLSQAYSKGDGIFSCPPWMKIMIRDVNDPLSLLEEGKSGAINIIDLANIHSVSFLATQDLGKITAPNEFQILGRFDNSDIRGCNLLIA